MILRYKVIVKDAPEFKEGLGAGVIAEIEVVYPEGIHPNIMAGAIVDQKQKFMEEYVSVTVEEV